jgi:hypothetical protein
LLDFRRIAERLIPLSVVSAFLAFTLCETGAAKQWQRQRAALAHKPRASGDGDECPQQRGIRMALLIRPDFAGEPGGIRTRGLLIKSQLLYRLSYGLAAAIENIRGAAQPVNLRRAARSYHSVYANSHRVTGEA